MFGDAETSVFYPRHKELRAAVCMSSGLPLGNRICDKILSPGLHFCSRAADVASGATCCQRSKNIGFREKDVGASLDGKQKP